MPSFADISQRALAALSEADDYYSHTKLVWRFFQKSINDGARVKFQNFDTGKEVDQDVLVNRSQHYVVKYLTSWTFQHMVAIFETFFFESLQLWLATYPGRLSNKQVEFGKILEKEKAEIVQMVIEKEINEITYGRVTEWFKRLNEFKLKCPTDDEIGRLAEIKASRDVLVHGNAKTNRIYVDKAGKYARYKIDEPLEINEKYLHESRAFLQEIIKNISTSYENKV